MTTLARGFVKRHGRRGCFAGGPANSNQARHPSSRPSQGLCKASVGAVVSPAVRDSNQARHPSSRPSQGLCKASVGAVVSPAVRDSNQARHPSSRTRPALCRTNVPSNHTRRKELSLQPILKETSSSIFSYTFNIINISATHLPPWLTSSCYKRPSLGKADNNSEERTSAEGGMKHSRSRSRLRPRDALLPASPISNSLPERDRQLLQNHVSGDRNRTSLRILGTPHFSAHRIPSTQGSWSQTPLTLRRTTLLSMENMPETPSATSGKQR